MLAVVFSDDRKLTTFFVEILLFFPFVIIIFVCIPCMDAVLLKRVTILLKE